MLLLKGINKLSEDLIGLRMKKKLQAKLIFVLLFMLMLGQCSITAQAANDATASVMRLEKTTGEVKLTNASGKASQIIEKMRLNTGDDIVSAAKSYAYISLDDSKAVKLDEQSEAVVNKDNNKYEVVLERGNLLFNVDKPLEGTESLTIKSATMTMGVRGTCAQVLRKSDNVTSICLLDGTLSCTLTDNATGNTQSIVLQPGDYADFCTGPGYVNNCQITTRRVVFEDLRGFTLTYVWEHPELAQKIFNQTGLDLRGITMQQAETRQESDEEGETVTVDAGKQSPTADWYSRNN